MKLKAKFKDNCMWVLLERLPPKLLAKKYKLAFLSSGLLYRYASYLILKINQNKIEFLKKKFARLNYKKLYKINLQTPKISEQSALVAKILGVRNILKISKRFYKKYGCVIEVRCVD